MLVHAAAHLAGLQVERLVAQADLAALLEEAEHQPQECERAGYAAEEVAEFVKLQVRRVLALRDEVHHQPDPVERGEPQADHGQAAAFAPVLFQGTGEYGVGVGGGHRGALQRLFGPRRVVVAPGFAEHALQPLGHRACRLARRRVDRVGMLGHADGLGAGGPRLDRAGLVVNSALGPVLVADVDFEPGEPVFEAGDLLAHRSLDALRDIVRAHDAAVGIELDLHGMCLSLSRACVVQINGRERRDIPGQGTICA